MTDQEINIELAEACGWTNIEVLESNGVAYGFRDGKKVPYKQPIPNFSTDLNAMHAVEESLTEEQIYFYVKNLFYAMCDSPEMRIGTIHATGRQRAEAFLRTKGLWKENT